VNVLSYQMLEEVHLYQMGLFQNTNALALGIKDTLSRKC